MKRIISIITVFAVIMFSFNCCENSSDSKPSCEKNDFGTVIVKNDCSFRLVVDVTEGSSEMNDERWLSPGSKTTYNKIDEGNITIWASKTGDQNSWHKDSHNLDECEEFSYRWYETKKSSNSPLYLSFEIGNRIIETYTDIESEASKN